MSAGPSRAITVFLGLTVCLSGVFWLLINLTGTPNQYYIMGLMWTPGLAALLTCRMLGRPLSSLGWRWPGARYAWIGYAIPIAYGLAASMGIWLFGFGGFGNPTTVAAAADSFGITGAPDWLVIALFVLLVGTTAMAPGLALALGEEIGWRGFLVPELAKALPFTGVALVSGFIWAAWHYPITAVVYRDADLPAWFWLPTFTVTAVAVSFAQAWLRLRTDSLWPPVFLHASHNLWMQSVFSPLTSDTDMTKWVGGDLGLGCVLVTIVVAVVFWLKRGELPAANRATSPAP